MDFNFLKSKKLIVAITALITLTIVMITKGLPVEAYSALFGAIIGLYQVGQVILDASKKEVNKEPIDE